MTAASGIRAPVTMSSRSSLQQSKEVKSGVGDVMKDELKN